MADEASAPERLAEEGLPEEDFEKLEEKTTSLRADRTAIYFYSEEKPEQSGYWYYDGTKPKIWS